MHRREFLLTASALLATRAIAARTALRAKEYRATRQFADTRFGRIAYVERGSGRVALFLHGFPLNSFQWRGAIERLSGIRRCIAPDFLAMGFTEVAAGQGVGPAAQTEMIAAFLDGLRVDSVDLVASDSGGAVAQLFAVAYPHRVRTMLLTNCDTEPDSPPPALLPVIELSRSGKFVDEWLVPWLADKTLARSAKGIGGMCYADPKHPTDEAIEMYFGPLVRSAESKALVHAYALGLEKNPLEGIAAKLAKCAVPTRIVWGTADTIFSPKSPDYLNGILPKSRGVRRLDGSKLFWPEERPDIVADEARQLWHS